MSEKKLSQKTTRRELIKKAAYVAPSVLTLTAMASFASAGSGGGTYKEKDRVKEKGK